MWHDKSVVFHLGKRHEEQPDGAIVGSARVDPRTKKLTRRLQEGDIAVINHVDLDRVAAESLVERKPAAVLNAAKSTSGRYPNLGPGILNEAGVPLIDDLGPAVMDLRDGDRVEVDENGEVRRNGEVIAAGTVQTAETIARAAKEAQAGMATQLKAFATNTQEYIGREKDLIFDGLGVPDIRTKIAGRDVLVVVRGYRYKEDIAALRPYIREYRPLLIGVDGGADAILETGYKPDIIVGDMDSVSDRALLRSGAEIVVHAYRDGRAPGKKRVEDLGVPHVVFPCTGTSEDVAMLLANAKGARLIVAVGTHNTLVEFLDKGRSGMASTFLTRLAVGGKLIDAKGVSRVYRSRISNGMIALLVVAGLAAVLVALASTTTGRLTLSLIATWLGDVWHSLTNLF